jgi:hypothetical protein
MLGHTKGNTKSNRKKIKSQQVTALLKVVNALEDQLAKVQLQEEYYHTSLQRTDSKSSDSSEEEY